MGGAFRDSGLRIDGQRDRACTRRYGSPMARGVKQVLGIVFVLAAIGCVIAYFVATNNYDAGWVVYGTEPPQRPKPLIYFSAAGALLVAALVMFKMASADKTSRGLVSPPPPVPLEPEARAKEADAAPDNEGPA